MTVSVSRDVAQAIAVIERAAAQLEAVATSAALAIRTRLRRLDGKIGRAERAAIAGALLRARTASALDVRTPDTRAMARARRHP